MAERSAGLGIRCSTSRTHKYIMRCNPEPFLSPISRLPVRVACVSELGEKDCAAAAPLRLWTLLCPDSASWKYARGPVFVRVENQGGWALRDSAIARRL
jgi:hypothetical protein